MRRLILLTTLIYLNTLLLVGGNSAYACTAYSDSFSGSSLSSNWDADPVPGESTLTISSGSMRIEILPAPDPDEYSVVSVNLQRDINGDFTQSINVNAIDNEGTNGGGNVNLGFWAGTDAVQARVFRHNEDTAIVDLYVRDNGITILDSTGITISLPIQLSLRRVGNTFSAIANGNVVDSLNFTMDDPGNVQVNFYTVNPRTTDHSVTFLVDNYSLTCGTPSSSPGGLTELPRTDSNKTTFAIFGGLIVIATGLLLYKPIQILLNEIKQAR